MISPATTPRLAKKRRVLLRACATALLTQTIKPGKVISSAYPMKWYHSNSPFTVKFLIEKKDSDGLLHVKIFPDFLLAHRKTDSAIALSINQIRQRQMKKPWPPFNALALGL